MKRSLLSYLSHALRSVRGPLLLGLLAPTGGALAQTAPPAKPASTNQTHQVHTELPPVVVTASPIPSSLFDLAQPASVLTEEKLRQQLASTLGETLARQPGINSTYFGPNASRPVIRGLGGDRIRVLQNGLGTMDASNTSDDHAVAADPIALKRVEVVRGPAALLYGPNAVGGVVNQIDGRIPEHRLERAFSGRADVRVDSPSSGKVGALMVEGGAKNGWNYHLDGFRRESENLAIPGFAQTAAQRATTGSTAAGKLPGSQAKADGGAIGTSYVWDKGYLGASFQGLNNDYGVVIDPAVNIRLHQRRFDVAGAFLQPFEGLQSIKYKVGRADYRHTEYDAGAAGTIFNSLAYNARIEALHNQVGPLEGAIGYEVRDEKLSATGDEAFLPPNRTSINSLFMFEELKWDTFRLQFGGRVDFVNATAEAVPTHPNNFFPSANSRSFTTGSGSLGLVYRPVQEWSGALNVSYTQRAPTVTELYANGPHAATGVFEIGNRNFNSEGNLSLDLSVRRETGHITGRAGFFYHRFSNFMTPLASTLGGASLVNGDGVNADDGSNGGVAGDGVADRDADADGNADDSFNVVAFRGVRAEFYGFEGLVTWHLLEEETQSLHLDLKSDYVRARDLSNNSSLPRIAPLRFGGELGYDRGPFSSAVEVLRVERQGSTAAGERPTPGYLMLNAEIAYKFGSSPNSVEIALRGLNLLDQEARNHVSFLKEVAPLPGRGAMVSLRATF